MQARQARARVLRTMAKRPAARTAKTASHDKPPLSALMVSMVLGLLRALIHLHFCRQEDAASGLSPDLLGLNGPRVRGLSRSPSPGRPAFSALLGPARGISFGASDGTLALSCVCSFFSLFHRCLYDRLRGQRAYACVVAT